MKHYEVKIELIGLTGKYYSHVQVVAKNEKSAIKKAEKTIGNRDGWVIGVSGLIPNATTPIETVSE